MIIGVALVVSELNKGERLVFRYPESVPSNVLNANEAFLRFHNDYLNLSPDNFAKLFRPKASLYNKVLEIAIDDIRYISFPCPCLDEHGADLSGQDRADAIALFNVVIATVRESAMQKIFDDLEKSDGNTSRHEHPLYLRGVSLLDTDEVGVEPTAAALGLKFNPRISSSKVLRRVVETISRALLHQEKRHRYVTRQVALMLRLQESGAGSIQLPQLFQQGAAAMGATSTTDGSSVSGLTSPTTITLSTSYTTSSNFAPSIVPYASNGPNKSDSFSMVPISGSIDPDRLLNGYVLSAAGSEKSVSVSSTGSGMVTTTTTVAVTATTTVTTNSSSHQLTTTGIPPPTNTAVQMDNSPGTVRERLQVMELMLQQSSLGNELRQLYHSLAGGHSVNLTINGSISFDVRLSSDEDRDLTGSSSMHSAGSGLSQTQSLAESELLAGTGAETSRMDQNDGVASSIMTLLTVADTSTTLNLLQVLEGVRYGQPFSPPHLTTAGTSDMSNNISSPVGVRPRTAAASQKFNSPRDGPIRGRSSSNSSFPGMSLESQLEIMTSKARTTMGGSRGSSAGGGGGGRGGILGPSRSDVVKGIGRAGSGGGRDNNNDTSRDWNGLNSNSVVHPELYRLISLADPTKSLEELSVIMEQPLYEVQQQSRHLCDWGLARLVPTVTADRRYKPHPCAPLDEASKVARAFSAAFVDVLAHAATYEVRVSSSINGNNNNNGSGSSGGSNRGVQSSDILHMVTPPHPVDSQTMRTTTSTHPNSVNNTNSSANNANSSVHSTGSISRTENFSATSSSRQQIGTGYTAATVTAAPSMTTSQILTSAINSVGGAVFGTNTTNAAAAAMAARSGPLMSIDKVSEHADRSSAPPCPPPPPSLSSSSSSSTAHTSDASSKQATSGPHHSSLVLQPFPMSRVLAVFNGSRTMEQAIRKLPTQLQPFAVDMVVWFLRRRMLVEVQRYHFSVDDVAGGLLLGDDER